MLLWNETFYKKLVQTFYKKLVDLFLQKEVETSLNIADIWEQ